MNKFLNNILDVEFEDTFYKLDEKLQEIDLAQNAILYSIGENPHLLLKAGKLFAYASREYEDLSLQYKTEKARLKQNIINDLEVKKKNKIISRQITSEFVEHALCVTYPNFVKSWESKISDAKIVRDLSKTLLEAYQARVTGTQSINKKLQEASEKRRRTPAFRR